METALVVGIFALFLMTGVVAWQVRGQKLTLTDFSDKLQANVETIPEEFAYVAGRQLKEGLVPVFEHAEQVVQQLAAVTVLAKDLTNSINTNAQQIDSLTKALEHTHGEFNTAVVTFDQALATLAEPGAVQMWLNNLPELVSPLSSIQDSIENSFETNRNIVVVVQGMLDEWVAQRGELERHSRSIADSVNSLAQDEIIRWKKEEELLNRQSEAMIEQATRSADGLGEVSVKLRDLAHLEEHTQDEIRRVSDLIERSINASHTSIEELTNIVRQETNRLTIEYKASSETLRESTHALHQTTASLNDYLARLGRELLKLAEQLNRIGAETRNWQTQIEKDTRQQLSELSGAFHKSLTDFSERHLQIIANLEEHHQRMLADQEAINEQLKLALQHVPTRQQQWIQTGLLSVLIILGIIALIAGL